MGSYSKIISSNSHVVEPPGRQDKPQVRLTNPPDEKDKIVGGNTARVYEFLGRCVHPFWRCTRPYFVLNPPAA